jgi:hypothetical protein
MSRILREPLLHFLIAGALLFLVFDVVNQDQAEPDIIVIDTARVASLSAQFERTWNRRPTESEMEGLINSWLEEELLYREGLALGLERSDPVVRRRVAPQVGFISESLNDGPPDEEALQQWLDDHPEQYRQTAQYTFRQLYFNPDQFGDELMLTAKQALAELEAGKTGVESSQTMLPGELREASPAQVARVFGQDFAAGIEGQPQGEWFGPVTSGFGLHLVLIDSKTLARDSDLAEVRAAVERDLLYDRNQRARAALIDALKKQYVIQRADRPASNGGATVQSQ